MDVSIYRQGGVAMNAAVGIRLHVRQSGKSLVAADNCLDASLINDGPVACFLTSVPKLGFMLDEVVSHFCAC